MSLDLCMAGAVMVLYIKKDERSELPNKLAFSMFLLMKIEESIS